MNQSSVVQEYEFNNPDIHEEVYLLDEVIEDCINNSFHTFEYRFVRVIKLTNISNIEEVILTITHRSIEFKSEYYGLNKKIKNARKNGFIFKEIVRLTTKLYSNLSKINTWYYLKFPLPTIHRQFFRKRTQTREYVETYCIVLHNPFQFARRKWYLDNQSSQKFFPISII